MKIQPLLYSLVLLGLTSAASAQEMPAEPLLEVSGDSLSAPVVERTPLSIGIMGGYGMDLYYGTIDLAADPELGEGNCGTLKSGVGNAVAAGLFAEYLLPSGIAVGARLLSAPISGSVVAPSGSTGAFRRPDGSLAENTSDNRMELRIPVYQLELYGSFQPFDLPLSITGGPRIGVAGAAEYTLKEELTGAEDLKFRDGRRYRVISEGDPGASLLFGLAASARYPLRLSRTVDMIPELALGTTLNSITKYGTMRAANVRLGIALRYTFPVPGLAPPEPPPLPPPIAVVDSVPPPPVAAAPTVLIPRVAAAGIDRSGAARPTVLVEVRERVTAREIPLLPYLFFDEASAVVPSRYDGSTSATAANEALATYGNLLRIIGERLVANPAERITLRGTTSGSSLERASKGLPTERARAVRRELVTRWGIDSARIAVEGRQLPATPSAGADSNSFEENRRVEIIGSETILAPVMVVDTVRTITSPGIRFSNAIDAERGLASWQVEMLLAGRPIRRLRGDADLTRTIDDLFTPAELVSMARGDGPIGYTLDVRDNDAKQATSDRSTIEIEVERSGGDRVIPAGSADAPAAIVLFDYNSSELRPAARAMLGRLRSRLPAGSTLKLVGFADETGEAEYNRKLSLARARAVSEALGSTTTDVEGAGESTLLYDNSAPEGRFYSRSVRIEVVGGE